jgi:hypothetical protein
MAVEAFCGFGSRTNFPITERKDAASSLPPAFLDVIHTLTMTGFASISICWAIINPFICVNGF